MQDSFDGVSTTLKSQLFEEQMNVVRSIFEKLKKEQLTFFLEMLFECILLIIDIPQKDAESVDMAKVMYVDFTVSILYVL